MATTGNWNDNISAHIKSRTYCNTTFLWFFRSRNSFLKSVLGFNYIFGVILPFDMVVFLLYTVSQKRETLDFCPYLRQIWTDFHNYFTSTFSMKFAIKWLSNIPSSIVDKVAEDQASISARFRVACTTVYLSWYAAMLLNNQAVPLPFTRRRREKHHFVLMWDWNYMQALVKEAP